MRVIKCTIWLEINQSSPEHKINSLSKKKKKKNSNEYLYLYVLFEKKNSSQNKKKILIRNQSSWVIEDSNAQ
jgi:hypothetical protein